MNPIYFMSEHLRVSYCNDRRVPIDIGDFNERIKRLLFCPLE